MPLIESCSMDAFSENVKINICEGMPRAQAIAVARDVLRRSCEAQGKESPIEKGKKKKRTTEFLEAALDRARKILNPRDFAVLFRAARGAAGGKVKAKNRKEKEEYEKVEKASAEVNNLPDAAFAAINPGGEKDAEGKTTPRDLRKLPHHTAAVENPNDNGTVDIPRLRNALARFDQTDFASDKERRDAKRHLDRHAAALLPNSEAAEERATKRSELAKDFFNGYSDGGMHAHGLDRNAGVTYNDGAHCHVWVMPGTNNIITSYEDGTHVHEVEGNSTKADGGHVHEVYFFDGEDEQKLITSLGGQHNHELMVSTSGVGGLHTHTLKFADGTEMESMTPEAIAELFGSRGEGPIDTHNVIGGLLIARDLERHCEYLKDKFEDRNGLLQDMLLDGMEDKTTIGDIIPVTVEQADDGSAMLRYSDDAPMLDGVTLHKGDIVDIHPDGTIAGLSKFKKAAPLSVCKLVMEQHGDIKYLRDKLLLKNDDADFVFVLPLFRDDLKSDYKALDGEVLDVFKKHFLDPLANARVKVGYIPDEKLTEENVDVIKKHVKDNAGDAMVIAVSKSVKEILGDVSDQYITHPRTAKESGDFRQVVRKINNVKEAFKSRKVDKVKATCNNKDAPPTDGGELIDRSGDLTVQITKSNDEQQRIYGVVLDPYQVDAHNDWIPPRDVKETATRFLKESRVIGFEHQTTAKAVPVESFVEAYPSDEDEKLAYANEPHKAYVRKFGNDKIHSGAWILGVELGDEEWALVKSGEIDAFSIGGFGEKYETTTSEMPQVEFVKPE